LTGTFKSLGVVLFSVLLLHACAAVKKEAAPTVAPVPQSADDYLKRGNSLVDAAQKFNSEQSPMPGMGGVFGWPPDTETYRNNYTRAASDFQTVLDKFPQSAAAPEAQFMLGLINDHPHLNEFDRALEAYRLTMERYPGTAAAEKARLRKEAIEKIMK
jgi:hypothetical protein